MNAAAKPGLPASIYVSDVGEVRKAKDDGRLPMEDHNSRLVVIGKDATDTRHVAEAIAKEAFHNASYFPVTFEDARTAVEG